MSVESAAGGRAPHVHTPRRGVQVVVGVVTLFVLLGALLPQRGLFVVLRADPPIRSLPVTIVDRAGVVLGVEEVTVDIGSESISGAPGRPNAIVYRWDGGGCDRVARIDVERSDGSVTLQRTGEEIGSACTLEAIGRSILIEFREPVDPSAVTDLTDLLY